MSSTPSFVQLLEALSAISLPVGGAMAAWVRTKKSAEREKTARETAARLAADKAARTAREEEQKLRDALLKEKDSRITYLEDELKLLRDLSARRYGVPNDNA